MKAYEGFILVPDVPEDSDAEAKMIPYFPYVRNCDIITANPIIIEDHLRLMSERWILNSAYDSIDKTTYIFECNYLNLSEDDSDEVIGSSYLQALVQYDLYRNGELEVTGNIRLNGTKVPLTETRDLIMKKFYLPFAIPGQVSVKAGYLFGDVEGTTVVGSLEPIIITNKNLNPKGSQFEHYGLITFRQITPNPDSDTAAVLNLAYQAADKEFNECDYTTYVDNHLPIEFTITGAHWQ